MTLKEELEILRGEPIQVYEGNPMDIPCIETSDPEKLCKHPVVSVHMITYNHEHYIRQAIEGVMMQKTDFEFELVIGEDCSQDKTREICFEYQEKYPDKIRVLWWHENVSKFGGNGRRNRAHWRGEFIAFCEGDDYWIDPLKLQKQVDVLRKHSGVGLVFTNGFLYDQSTGCQREWDWEGIAPFGFAEGEKFLFLNVYSRSPFQGLRRESFLCTASVMIRRVALFAAREKHKILSWKLRLGDVQTWLSLASVSDVYGLSDKTMVYRIHGGGACARLGGFLWRDNLLVRIYFNKTVFELECSDLSPAFTSEWINVNCSLLRQKSYLNRVGGVFRLFTNKVYRPSVFGHAVSRKLVCLYARYCSCKVTCARWRSLDMNAMYNIGRTLMPEISKRLWRRVMRRGEFVS